MNGSSYIVKNFTFELVNKLNKITLVSSYVCSTLIVSNSQTISAMIGIKAQCIFKFRMKTCEIFTGLLFLCMI